MSAAEPLLSRSLGVVIRMHWLSSMVLWLSSVPGLYSCLTLKWNCPWDNCIFHTKGVVFVLSPHFHGQASLTICKILRPQNLSTHFWGRIPVVQFPLEHFSQLAGQLLTPWLNGGGSQTLYCKNKEWKNALNLASKQLPMGRIQDLGQIKSGRGELGNGMWDPSLVVQES